jgi:hypothetical protein
MQGPAFSEKCDLRSLCFVGSRRCPLSDEQAPSSSGREESCHFHVLPTGFCEGRGWIKLDERLLVHEVS